MKNDYPRAETASDSIATSRAPDATMSHPHPIPTTLNVCGVVVCSALCLGLLYAASHASSLGEVLACAVVFAIALVPLYSLIHEAEHEMLVPNRRWNDLLGRWLCVLFIVSFAFLRHCHLRHHRKNRTDIEMWDLYLESQVPWQRRWNLYLMMGGFGYLMLWLSVVLFAFAPPLVYAGLFQKHTEMAGFLEGTERKLNTIRWESGMVIALWALAFWLLDLDLVAFLVLYAAAGFLWSSQVYVNHAFSPRDITDGAHNLKMPRWLRPVYLNFNLHLAHHQHPHVPWIHLPRFVDPSSLRIHFHWNYLRLWGGPALTHEPNPVLGRRAVD
jgi:fatty acid desaturase